MTPARFVILHHEAPEGEHYDLMLEHQAHLMTWRLESSRLTEAPMPARRIGDHRLTYLDYEGPVNGNRGRVRRVEGGGLTIQRLCDSLIRFELRGEKVSGRWRLVLVDVPAGLWRLEAEPNPV